MEPEFQARQNLALDSHTSDNSSADESLHARIVESLREMIISGDLPAGTRLRERSLSIHFGVSRVPIREAILILETQGLVQSEPRTGAFVKSMTLKDAKELFVVLSGLEPLAASLAAQNRDQDDLDSMNRYLDEAEHAAENGDYNNGSLANTRFHLAILKASKNDLLNSIIVPLRPQIRRLFRETIVSIAGDLCRSHRELFDAVQSQDADLAAKIALSHSSESRLHGRSLFD